MSTSHLIRTPQQLGPIMRALRRQAGFTQAQLAARLGISRQAVTALEREPDAATFERLMKVWAVLGVEVSLRQGSAKTTDTDLEW